MTFPSEYNKYPKIKWLNFYSKMDKLQLDRYYFMSTNITLSVVLRQAISISGIFYSSSLNVTTYSTHGWLVFKEALYKKLYLAVKTNENYHIFSWYFEPAAKSLQSCLTLCDPIDSSPPGSPSLGFSRQEHWSGLPFPFPIHESEKWKQSRSVVSDS